MPKKRLDTTAIANELSHSQFFAPPSPSSLPAVPPVTAPVRVAVPQPPASPLPLAPMVRTDEPLIDRSNERTTIRHSFDILADQLFSLRQIALTREQHTGQRVLVGDLVKEALDLFIAQQRTNA